MLIRKGFKFEIYPNAEQVRKMNQFCGCFRFLYNQGLAFQKENRFKDYEKIKKLRGTYTYFRYMFDNNNKIKQLVNIFITDKKSITIKIDVFPSQVRAFLPEQAYYIENKDNKKKSKSKSNKLGQKIPRTIISNSIFKSIYGIKAFRGKIYNETEKELAYWRLKYNWLEDCHSQVRQEALKNLGKAFDRFFEGLADFPQFKKKGKKDSFHYPQPKSHHIDLKNKRIFLSGGIEWVKCKFHRELIGKAKNLTISKKCGKWFVSIQTEFEQEVMAKKGGEVGIDLGIKKFITLSTGEYFSPINAFKRLRPKLTKLQRKLKNKTKFSKNWKKLQNKISRLHNKIANIRKNYLHQTSHKISENQAIVYMEDLKIKNMSKSAKGNEEKHGKNVKAKSGLNRAILDQSWAELQRQLEYKMKWKGGEVILVSPENTSRTCPCCGCVDNKNRKTQASFRCIKCGYNNNADKVAAINILRFGQAKKAGLKDFSGQEVSVATV